MRRGDLCSTGMRGGSGDSFVLVAAQIKKLDDYTFKGHIIGTCSYFDADLHTNTHSGTHTYTRLRALLVE